MFSILGLGLGLIVRVRISVLYASNACTKRLKIENKTPPQKKTHSHSITCKRAETNMLKTHNKEL